MNRHLSLLLGLLLCVPALWAGPIDKEQALEKAREFYSRRGQASKVKKLKQVPRATEVSTAMENDCFYVFNAGEDDGFVIISGDDRTPEVLGYADSGTFRADDMPENMKAWLDEYASQIRHLAGQGSRVNGQSLKVSTHPAVEPLMQTRWNQDAPYNGQCPVFFDESKYGQAVTGCVALALAQVMKSWNYPDKTLKAIPGYTCTTDWSSYIGSSSPSYISTPSMDVTTFDWGNMLNTYDSSASSTQKKAVATLLQTCATALQADFGIDDTGGTSADAQNLKGVLTDYFDYDKSMRYVSRSSYTSDEWDNLIYAEMNARRPVFFSGRSTTSGHTFVVDGYDGQGYYHVNWGWGGLNNGYFLLGILTPEDESGIGAGKRGYNFDVSALIGVKPNAGGDQPATDVLTCQGWKPFQSSYTRSSASSDFTGILAAFTYYNKTGRTAKFDLGVGIYDSNRNLKKVIPSQQKVELQPNSGISYDYTKTTFDFGAGISNGNYFIAPISKLSAATEWLPCNNVWFFYYLAVISGNTLTMMKSTDKMDAELTLTNTPEVNGPADVRVTITNNGLYYNGNIFLYDGDNNNYYYVNQIELQKGETKTLDVSLTFSEQKTYNVWLFLSGGSSALAAIPITPTAAKAQTLTCTYDVTNANASTRVIDGNQMEMTIEYQNTGANNYDNEIRLNLIKRIGDTNAWTQVGSTTDRLTLSKGGKTKRSYVFRDLEDGTAYMVRPMYKSNGQYRPMTGSEFYTIRFAAKEAYAVVSGNTLTFYYDGNKAGKTGNKYAMNTGDNTPGWVAEGSSIRKVVVDASFADYRPTTTAHWFENETNLTTIEGLTNLNTSSATSMQKMFYACSSIKSLDLRTLDTRNVTDMSWMFARCKQAATITIPFKTPKVTKLNNMFDSCMSVKTLDLSTFNTANVTTMNRMFTECYALEQLNISSFNTEKVTDMSCMFYDNRSLEAVDVSSFRTLKLMDMSFMFRGCKKLQMLDLSGFTTGPVEYMNVAFYDCQSLKTIYASNDWSRINVQKSDWMFGNCYSLVGGAGTKYDASHIREEYARIDGGTSKPGYFTYKPAGKRGDVNGDGSVDVADIAAIIDKMAGSSAVSASTADVNSDGSVDVADIAAVIDIMAANARKGGKIADY